MIGQVFKPSKDSECKEEKTNITTWYYLLCSSEFQRLVHDNRSLVSRHPVTQETKGMSLNKRENAGAHVLSISPVTFGSNLVLVIIEDAGPRAVSRRSIFSTSVMASINMGPRERISLTLA
ncbi:hypothetical protein E2C01_019795 [Portunus trituberculatus]|uniref:Uncharacterized protein n=1 Tax=Portunus trituberculatus TaxID=210409 RepID=A0A5B7DZU5_PORTR|nr:hypothetical protein [Portunus trituberculatus]